MDAEIQAKLDGMQTSHEDFAKHTLSRIEKIERVQETLQSDVDEIRSDQANDRLMHAKEYGELKLSIDRSLNQALAAVPREFLERHERELREKEVAIERSDKDTNKKILKWSIISATITAVSVLMVMLHV